MTFEDSPIVHNLFADHFAALCCTYRFRDNDGDQCEEMFTISGFLLQTHQPLWVTAGHCMKGIEDILEKRLLSEFEIISGGFNDFQSYNATNRQLVPYTLDISDFQYLEIEEDGIDIAMMPLDSNKCRLILANKNRFIGPENWQYVPKGGFQSYYLYGIPREFYLVPNVCFQNILMLPLTKTEGHSKISDRWFEGKLIPSTEQQKLKLQGMSGGPIFGIYHENDVQRYCLIAIQSRYIEKSGIVLGCSMKWLEEYLDQAI